MQIHPLDVVRVQAGGFGIGFAGFFRVGQAGDAAQGAQVLGFPLLAGQTSGLGFGGQGFQQGGGLGDLAFVQQGQSVGTFGLAARPGFQVSDRSAQAFQRAGRGGAGGVDHGPQAASGGVRVGQFLLGLVVAIRGIASPQAENPDQRAGRDPDQALSALLGLEVVADIDGGNAEQLGDDLGQGGGAAVAVLVPVGGDGVGSQDAQQGRRETRVVGVGGGSGQDQRRNRLLQVVAAEDLDFQVHRRAARGVGGSQ